MEMNEADEDERDTSEPVTLGLTIRRTRLVAFTLLMLIIIGGFTLWFHHGVALSHFDSRDKNATEQTKLLDDYNSYSGNVATIFATPVELFVTVAVQVIVLRFMADTFTRPEMSWKISGITLLLGAGVGYMISNGFNALNVQLRPEEMKTVIFAADLGVRNGYEEDGNTVTELAPRNSVMNTILRETLVDSVYTGVAVCPVVQYRDVANTVNGTVDEVALNTLKVGFSQREWQSRVLKEAVPSDMLRLIVNPTDKTINNGVNGSALPMKARTAAAVFESAMTSGTYYFPWGERRGFVNRSDVLRRYPVNDSGTHNFTDSLPRMYGLLPMDANASETEQREFFVQAVLAAASRQFARANRTKISDIVMDFTHTQIAPAISFDAVTIEFELEPDLLATNSSTSADNVTTRYTVLDTKYNCPAFSRCLVPKARYTTVEPAYDAPAQVVAFQRCVNSEGGEETNGNVTIRNNSVAKLVGDCWYVKDDAYPPAVLIVSIGKRLVADALEQNVSISPNGTKVYSNESVTVTNLRKIYSFTVGRLGWEVTDLGKQFNAECGTEDDGGCLGVHLPLSTTNRDTTTVQKSDNQVLVAGENNIRAIQSFLQPDTTPYSFTKTELLTLIEPPNIPVSSPLYKTMAGDLLLPHNVRNVTWDDTFVNPECDYEVEYHHIEKLANHHYMEHSLQTAYTAGTFYIFQNAVVRDVISLSSSVKSLAFQGNSQSIAVWVSTPTQNMWLTLSGCFVLVVGLLGAVATTMWFAPKEKDALANITEPHAIARVMMDERHYPPIFLHRRIVEKGTVGTVDEFAIAGLSLHQQREQRRQQQEQQQQGQQPVEPKRDTALEVAFIP